MLLYSSPESGGDTGRGELVPGGEVLLGTGGVGGTNVFKGGVSTCGRGCDVTGK